MSGACVPGERPSIDTGSVARDSVVASSGQLLAESPTLMRLRELEVLERIASACKLNIVVGDKSLGEKGLAENVVNLL